MEKINTKSQNEERIELPLNDNPKASGFIHDLNHNQFQILQKFKERILKEKLLEDFTIFDDVYILRFLRARKFEMEKSFIMINEFFKWRKKENVDEMINYNFTEIAQVKRLYPHTYHKTDKLGRPIYIEKLGDVNLKELFEITTEDRMIKYYIREYERSMRLRFFACSKAKGKLIEQGFTILDLTGVGLSMMTGKVKNFIKLASDVGQNYYPEMLGKMFMINTSMMFKFIWTIVKGFIDEKTRNKMTVLKSDYHKQLNEWVDKDNLPTLFGGNCTCSHIKGGCMFSDIGPWNPLGGI